jgi:hypothetical protein
VITKRHHANRASASDGGVLSTRPGCGTDVWTSARPVEPYDRLKRGTRLCPTLLAAALVIAGVSATAGAQALMVPKAPALSVAPAQVSVLVGHQSDPITVKLSIPPQPAAGTGELLFRTLPAGITTAPSPVTYQYPGGFNIAAMAPAQVEATFRFVASGGAKPGVYDITISDGTFAVGSAKIALTVVSAGDVDVKLRSDSLRLCGNETADDAVVLTPLAGYQGHPTAYWSTVPAGITVTPRELSVAAMPPQQTIGFRVQATGAAPGTYTLVLTVLDRRLGIDRTARLAVRVGGCGDITIAFRKPSLSLCAGQTADDAVTLDSVGGYQGRPTLRWEGIPSGISITPAELAPAELTPAELTPAAMLPSQTMPFSLHATGAHPGSYTLTLRASDPTANVSQTAQLNVEVVGPDFTPSVSPNSMTLQAAGGTRGLVARLQGNPCFAPRTVTISVSGAPGGVTVKPATTEVAGPNYGPAQFSLTAGRQVPAGKTFTLTFTFQPSTGAAKTVPVTLSVTAAPDYELTVDPSKVSVAAGDAVDVTVQARSLNGFAGTVNVTAPQIADLSFSPATFPLQLGGVGDAVLAAGSVAEAAQKVTVTVSRRRAPGPVQAAFTGNSPSAPGSHQAALDLLVLPPRPTERVEGPRIDIVKPDTLLPGKLYDLDLTGKNLTLDTRISLGSDITIVGTPIFTLPTQAKVKVQVAPGAIPGRRVAEASNSEGSNRGPGGVMIGLVPIVMPKKPVCARLTTLTFAKAKLQLEDPEWGKHWEGEFQRDYGIPLLDDDTVFEWREPSPGTADYFELRVYDKLTGKLLVTRRIGSQTLHLGGAAFTYVPRSFRPDAQFLAELLPKVSRRMMQFRTANDWSTAHTGALVQGSGQPVSLSPAKEGVQARAGAANLGNAQPSQAVLGTPSANVQMTGAKVVGIDPTAGADLLWEVAGYKLYDPECVVVRAGQQVPSAGADGKIHMEVELSERWPLRVPNEPTGIACPGGAYKTGTVDKVPLSDKKVRDENGNIVYDVVDGQKTPRIDPNNYPGDVFALKGGFDLSFSPWAAHPKATMEPVPEGMIATSVKQFEFDSLPVKGSGSEPMMEWGRGIKLELPNPSGQTPEAGALLHSYDRTGTFTIRLFQLAENDAQHAEAAQLAMAIDGPQTSPYAALLAFEGGAGGVFPLTGSPKAGGGDPPAEAPGTAPTVVAGAKVGGAGTLAARPNVSATLANWQMSSPAILGRAYMIYCSTLTVTTREDFRASGPLHLDSIAVTGYPGHEPPSQRRGESGRPTLMVAGPAPVKVSDCDESLTAQATLRYYGKGKVRITWRLDGVAFSTEEKDIGPSAQAKNLGADPTKWPPPVLSEVTLDSDQLSVEKLGLHQVTVEAEVVPEPTPTNIRFAARTVTDAIQGRTPAPGDLKLAKAILGSGGGPPGDPLQVHVPAPGQMASAGVPPLVSLQPAADAVLGSITAVKGKPLFVASDPKPYDVVAGEAGKPCVFIFPTKFGKFRISGLEGNVTNVGTTFSGKGVLMLPLTKDSTSARSHAVEVTFSGWEVPDLQDVVKGTLDVSLDRQIDGPGLQGTLSHLTGEAGTDTELDATFDLEPKDTTLRIPGAVERPPEWKNVTAPVTGEGPGLVEGNWYKAGEKLPEVLIGWSAFQIRSDDVRLDWSRSEGNGASSRCGGGSGAAWVGVHLGSATLTPYTMDLTGAGGPYEQSVTDWGIEDAGLCGAVTTTPWKATLDQGWVAFDAIQAVAHHGTFSALYKNMKVHVPWPETEFGGDAQLQSGGGKAASVGFAFTGSAPPQQYNDPPNRISMKARHLFFTQEENVGWAVRADTDFALLAEGKQFASFTADGMFFGFDGRAYFAKGAPSTTIALSGHASLGDTPLDLESVTLTAANSGAGRLHFAVKVTTHLSVTLPAAETQVNYDITRPGTDYVGSGPVTSPFSVAIAFPAGSPALQAKISPHYDGAQDTRFYGPLDLAMFGGPPIKAEFLLGYENGKSYWLTRAEYSLGPSGTPLVPPILDLYAVRGGIGYNFPITAFKNAASIKDAQPDFSGNFMFMAGIRVGSPDGGFAFTLDGDLTISPSVGARMDFHAWLVKNEHTGNGDFAGYFQWANGNFDGKLWGGLNLLNGVVKFDLGSSESTAAVALHFGSGDWYIHAGAPEGPRIKATVMNFGNVDAYLSLSNKGLEVGGSMSIYLGCSIGHVKGGVDVGLGITPAPGIFGHANAGLEAEVCAFGACVGVGVTAGVNFSALPVSISCHACVEIPIPFWNPQVCGDFSL